MPILVGLAFLCVYLVIIALLLQYVAPLFFLGTTLMVSATVSWICAKSFWQTYAPARGSVFGLVTIVGILLLLYSDFLLLLGTLAATSVETGPQLQQGLAFLPSSYFLPIVGGLAGVPPFGIAAILLSIAIKGLLLPVVLLFVRGLACEDRDPGEPAFLSYFEKAAFRDLATSLRQCIRQVPGHLKPMVQKIVTGAFAGKKAWLLWPIGLSALLALVPPIIFVTIFLTVIVVTYGFGLVLLKLFNLYLALLLQLAERLVMKVRAGYAKCPHAGCYQPLPLPVFVCECGAEHRRLLPGRTGIFYRRCQCGESLATLFLLAKGNLRSRCPSERCQRELPSKVFGANLHLPICGGPEAGKTSFMAAGVVQLVRGGIADLETSWLRDRDRIDFEQQWEKVAAGGPGPRKTTETLPNAYLISLRRKSGLSASLYLYDSAGETFGSREKLADHRFMEYCSGLILVVDPLTFPPVLERVEGANAGAPASRSVVKVAAREVFDRVIQQLENLDRLERTRRLDQPVAVIVTKSDLQPLCRELPIATNNSLGTASRQGADPESDQTRSWLEKVDPALVHRLETRFRNVRYFAVAALPSVGQARYTGSVLAPLSWLFSWHRVLAQPELTRWRWAALEVAAFGGVALVALVPPFYLISFLLGRL